MNASKEVSINFTLTLPDAKDPASILTKISENFANNRFPPQLGDVSGYTRHIVSREVIGSDLLIKATVPENALKPTILNLSKVFAAASASAMMFTMFSDPDPVTVSSIAMIHDPATDRLVNITSTSYPDDAKNVATTGKVFAPAITADFFENTQPSTIASMESLTDWQKSIPELLDATWSYIEAGRQAKH